MLFRSKTSNLHTYGTTKLLRQPGPSPPPRSLGPRLRPVPVPWLRPLTPGVPCLVSILRLICALVPGRTTGLGDLRRILHGLGYLYRPGYLHGPLHLNGSAGAGHRTESDIPQSLIRQVFDTLSAYLLLFNVSAKVSAMERPFWLPCLRKISRMTAGVFSLGLVVLCQII